MGGGGRGRRRLRRGGGSTTMKMDRKREEIIPCNTEGDQGLGGDSISVCLWMVEGFQALVFYSRVSVDEI